MSNKENMNTKERLETNKQKAQQIAQEIQTIDARRQNLLQELLRLDGENRLLAELSHNEPEKDKVD